MDYLEQVKTDEEDALILKKLIGRSMRVQIHATDKGLIMRLNNGKEFDILKFKDPYSFVTTTAFTRINFNYPSCKRFYFGKGQVLIREFKRKKPGFFVEHPHIGQVFWPEKALIDFIRPFYIYHLKEIENGIL
jgi:hypothetical protein